MPTFMLRAMLDELADPQTAFFEAIDAWHAARTADSIYQWLGLSREEYADATGPDGDIRRIIDRRRAE